MEPLNYRTTFPAMPDESEETKKAREEYRKQIDEYAAGRRRAYEVLIGSVIDYLFQERLDEDERADLKMKVADVILPQVAFPQMPDALRASGPAMGLPVGLPVGMPVKMVTTVPGLSSYGVSDGEFHVAYVSQILDDLLTFSIEKDEDEDDGYVVTCGMRNGSTLMLDGMLALDFIGLHHGSMLWPKILEAFPELASSVGSSNRPN